MIYNDADFIINKDFIFLALDDTRNIGFEQ